MRKILLFIGIAISLETYAQFSDSVFHYIKFASGATINHTQDGNTFLLNNGFNFNVKKPRVSLNTAAGWIYGTSQKDVTNNDITVHGDLNFFKPGKKLYYWALVNIDKSYSLNIFYRVQAGAGLAYDFIDSPYLRINVSDGFLYEQSDITTDIQKHDVSATPRNSFRLLYRWNIKDRFSISGVHFIQPSLTNINNYILQSSNVLSVRVQKWLSLNATLLYNKVTATNRENLLITYGITAEKFF